MSASFNTSDPDAAARLASQYILPHIKGTPPSLALSLPTRPGMVSQAPLSSASVAEKKDDGGGGLLGGIKDVVGDVAGEVIDVGGQALDATGKYLARPIAGALTKVQAQIPASVQAKMETVDSIINPFDRIGVGINAMDQKEIDRIKNAKSFTEAFNINMEDENWLNQLVAEIGLDPTTYIGAGLFGRLAKTATIAPKLAEGGAFATRFYKLWDAANKFDEIQALPVTAVREGLRGAVRGAEKVAGLKAGEESGRSLLRKSAMGFQRGLQGNLDRGARTTEMLDAANNLDQLNAREIITEADRLATPTAVSPGGTPPPSPRDVFDRMNLRSLSGIADEIQPTNASFNAFGETLESKGYATRNAAGGFDIDQPRLSADAAASPTPTDPNLTATANLNDVLDQVSREVQGDPTATRVTNPAERQAAMDRTRALLEPHIGQNPEHFQSRELWDNPVYWRGLRNMMNAGSDKEARDAMVALFGNMNQMESLGGVMNPKLVTSFRKRFSTQRTRNVSRTSFFGNGVNNSVLNQDDLDFLQEAMNNPAMQQLQQKYNQDMGEVTNLMNWHAQNGFVNPVTDMTSAQELIDAEDLLRAGGYTKDADRIQKFRKDYDLTEEAAETINGRLSMRRHRTLTNAEKRSLDDYRIRDAYSDTFITRHFDEKARELGIDTKKLDASMWGRMAWVPKAWREQALLSPRYHLSNVLDMGIKSAIYGINPVIPSGSAQMQAGRWGMDSKRMDPRIFASREQWDFNDIDVFMGRVPATMGETFWGKLPGPLGKAADRGIVWNRAFAQMTDNAFRQAAWLQGAKDHMVMVRPRFDDEIRRRLAGPQAEQLIDLLNRTGNEKFGNKGLDFSPERIRRLSLRLTGNADQANELATIWSRQVDEANTAGVAMASNIHFPMHTEYALEDKLHLRDWMPFHFFATRNIPFYLETLAAHPNITKAWHTYNQLSDDERERSGIPSRFAGMVPGGDKIDGFMDTVFGPGRMFFNPLTPLSITDQTKKFSQVWGEDQGNQPLIGSTLDKLGSVGLSVAPWIQIPLSAAGAYGPDDETMPVLRHSQLIQSLTGPGIGAIPGLGLNNNKGYDLGESAFREKIVDRARELATGTRKQNFTGSAYKDNLIVNRIADMSVLATGQPQQPAFMKAAEEGPGNPVWDVAQKWVEDKQGRQNLLNFVNPIPTKSMSNVEAASLEARKSRGMDEGDPYDPALVDSLVRSGDLATYKSGYHRPSVVDEATGERVYNGPDNRVPQPFDKIPYEEQTKWGGALWNDNAQGVFKSKALLSAYKKWAKVQPEQYDASLGAFFRFYNIPLGV